MAESSDPQRILREFQKCNEFFVGIDSDGCAFDTMEVKHKECFIPNIIKYYNLAAVSKYAREAAEFINLYSQWRGFNRFPALIMSFDLLIERPEVLRRHHPIPALTGLRRWVERETKLSNPTLEAEVEATGNADLVQALEWSEAVNRAIGEVVHHVPPFSFVRESLESMQGRADVMVVSTTPGEALDREWQEHGLKPFVGLIAGQELGSKREHKPKSLEFARSYQRHRVWCGSSSSMHFPMSPSRRRSGMTGSREGSPHGPMPTTRRLRAKTKAPPGQRTQSR